MANILELSDGGRINIDPSPLRVGELYAAAQALRRIRESKVKRFVVLYNNDGLTQAGQQAVAAYFRTEFEAPQEVKPSQPRVYKLAEVLGR